MAVITERVMTLIPSCRYALGAKNVGHANQNLLIPINQIMKGLQPNEYSR